VSDPSTFSLEACLGEPAVLVDVLRLDQPNLNGCVYWRESFERLPEEVPVFAAPASTPGEILSRLPIGVAKDFAVIGDTVTMTVAGKQAVELLQAGMAFRTEGTGVYNPDTREVSHFELTALVAVPRTEF